MAVKRRTIWMDDATWEWVTEKATDHGVNQSRYLITLLPQKTKSLENQGIETMSQAQRDAVLRKLSKTK